MKVGVGWLRLSKVCSRPLTQIRAFSRPGYPAHLAILPTHRASWLIYRLYSSIQSTYKPSSRCSSDPLNPQHIPSSPIQPFLTRANNPPVIYHSPLTTLTIIRISRQHYRLLWASITLLTHLGGVRVIPRVIGVSGTIKKLQNRAVGYHRVVIGQMVGAGLGGEMEEEGEREVGEIMGLEDR